MTPFPVRVLCYLCLAVAVAQAEPVTVVSGMFTVDMTPPSVPAALTPAAVTAPFLRLQASSTDAVSGVAAYDFGVADVMVDRATGYAVFRGLSNGTYTWKVRARDAAGNPSAWASYECLFTYGDDNDDDGLPDAWEVYCFGGSDYTDGSADSDLDGTSDLAEAEANTNGFEFYVTLVPGWNMIALPCNTTTESAAALVGAADGPIWMWDAAGLSYLTTTEPPARQGLWIFSNERKEMLPVSGTPPQHDFLQLELGWNLTGTGLPAVLDSTEGITSIMAWTDGAYELPDAAAFQFALLQGYWMRVSLAGQRQLLQAE